MTARPGRAEEFSQQDTLVIHEEQGGVSALKSWGLKLSTQIIMMTFRSWGGRF